METRSRRRVLGGLFWFFLSLVPAHAEVKLPAIFGDHMVLQCGVTLPVWGKAAPGEHVTVLFAGEAARSTADAAGKWCAIFRPLPPSRSPKKMVVEGRNRIEIQDVLVGDVWICAGEGNMDFPLSDASRGKDTPEIMADPLLRFFVCTKQACLAPDHAGEGNWVVCTPETVSSFSAVGYFFARDLRSTQRPPLGMIQCTTADDAPAQSWISREGLTAEPGFPNYLAEYLVASAQTGHQQMNAATEEGGDRAQRQVSTSTPSALFNGMIAPLIPYAMTGVLWYQGESNEGLAALPYRRLLPRLIRDWRRAWGEGPFPFFFVLPAGFGGEGGPVVEPLFAEDGTSRRGLPWLREGAACALTLPNTGMAVATDLGVPDDHQPPDKLDVGRRLALLARHEVYGERLVDAGPTYRAMQVEGAEGAEVRVTFDSVGGGLTLGSSPYQPLEEQPENSTTLTNSTNLTNGDNSSTGSSGSATTSQAIGTSGEEIERADVATGSGAVGTSIRLKGFGIRLRGFALSGDDGKWFPATAKIEGDSVLLVSDAVPHPKSVRYNWQGFPEGNLYNKEGLPAPPFRTDEDQPDGVK